LAIEIQRRIVQTLSEEVSIVRYTIALLAMLALVCYAALATAGEKIVLPDAVVKAVSGIFPNAVIDGTEVEKEAGINVYTIELKAARVEMEVAEDGTVLEITTFVDMKDVPEAAAAVIGKVARGATIKEIEKAESRAEVKKEGDSGRIVKLDNPSPVYEVKLWKGDRAGEMQIAPDGTILKPLKWSRRSGR
jgi:uncharacterized membrane protein YkoI